MGDCNTLKTFLNPHHCDPHLDQTKYNDLLPFTIDGVLVFSGNFGQTIQNSSNRPAQEASFWLRQSRLRTMEGAKIYSTHYFL